MAYNTDNRQMTTQFMKPTEIRQLTDKFSILLIPLGLLIWLGIGIYDEIFYSTERRLIVNGVSELFPESHIYGLITVLIIIVLLVILNILRDNWLISIAKFSIVITIFIAIVYIFWNIYYFLNCLLTGSLIILSIIISVLIYNLTILICTRELGVASLGPMIKDPIRSIMQSLTLLLLSYVIIFTLMLIYSISLPLAQRKDLYTERYRMERERFRLLSTKLDPYGYPNIYAEQYYMLMDLGWVSFLKSMPSFAFTIASIYVFNFIWNLGFMIMGDYFVHYYGSQKISKSHVLQSLVRVLRYHLGTVAFLSTPILPSFCALVMFFKSNKHPAKQSDNKLINFISKISLIIDIPEYALIQTSVHGSESLKSIGQMVDLHHSNPLLFLTLNTVTTKIMDFIKIIAVIIGWFAVTLYATGTRHIFGSAFSIEKFGVGVIFVYLANTLLWRPAVCTFAVYKMIRDQHESKTSSEQIELIC